jgi:serine/threonine-protein kinase
MIGESVLHYQIIRKLGSGGMGAVYEALDTKLQRPVALKVLHSDVALTPMARERFLVEASTASSLDHPNICTIYAIEESGDGELLLAMALYRGQTLDRLLRKGPLPFHQIVEIASQVCQALNATHTAGIIHRDIKPSNILVTEEGVVKVLDFGLSKISDGANHTRLTAPNQVMGTLLYISPEQLRGDAVDHRTDLWAMGAVLYEMTTGLAPFYRTNSTAIMRAIGFEDYTPPRDLRPDLPESIERVIQGTLRKNALERYASATQMLSDLGAGRLAGSSPSGLQIAAPSGPITHTTAIAVLPLQNLSADPENEYFSDGLTEELISALGRAARLRVVSRSSAFAFKGKVEDVRKIGEVLGVDVVLEGSVRRSGQRIRITLQLTNVADGYQLWSDRYDREMIDIFDLQDEISQTVVAALKAQLGADISQVRIARFTENVDAYELYLKGRYNWNQKTPEGMQLAFQYFQQALQIDPNFAMAHSGIADFYSLMATFWIMPAQQAWPLAKESAMRAMALNDRLATPHISLALVMQFYEWDWAGAEREMRIGISLRPQLGDSYVSYAYYLMTQGRLRMALDKVRVGLQYDPVSLPLRTTEAMVLTYLGDHDAAITLALQAIETAPYFIELYYVLGVAYMAARRTTNAIQILERGAAATRRMPLLLGWLGAAYVQAEDLAAAESVLHELLDQAKNSFSVPLPLAVLYTALNRKDEAFEWLNRAADARDTILCYIQSMPTFDPLRDDPRYGQLIDRMGFPREGQDQTSMDLERSGVVL